MKCKVVVVIAIILVAVNVLLGMVFLQPIKLSKLDLLTVNDLIYTCAGRLAESDLNMPEYEQTYAVLDKKGALFYTSKDSYAPNLQEATINRDTMIDLIFDNRMIGKLVIENDNWLQNRRVIREVALLMALNVLVILLILFAYMVYLNRIIFRPFHRLKEFAVRVAGGNLDFPLIMDENNVFGAFTESFDLMRDELKRAREQERLANQSKKELIAQLSHDIKTPIASIKAVAEVMSVSASEPKIQNQLAIIESKADQVDHLISNLFSATLEELQHLEVTIVELSSQEIYKLIEQADYLKRAVTGEIPQCLLQFDPMRLQQVLDNLLSNSYKYANTKIDITACISTVNPGMLSIVIQDYGQGVSIKDLSLIFEKFYRCDNAKGQTGSGLGLYISRYLMEKMGGDIICQNNDKGFCVILNLRIS